MEKITAEAIVRQLYLGIFGREPDQNGWIHYSEQIRNGKPISKVISTLITSEEFKNRYSIDKEIDYQSVEKLIKEFLDRNPSQEEVISVASKNKYDLIKWLINSVTFQELFFCRWHNSVNIIYNVEKKKFYVFLHPLKCAGSSLHVTLSKAFGQTNTDVFGFNFQIFNPFYLMDKEYIRTHLDYDIVNNYMIGKKAYFTILRDPLKRFLSQYYFERAHENKRYRNNYMSEIKSIKHLYLSQTQKMFSSRLFYNCMTLITMGYSKWQEWKEQLFKISSNEKQSYLDRVVRPFVRQRLSEFIFVGIQEEFDESVKFLCKALGKQEPEQISRVNVTEEKIRKGILNPVEKEEITPEIEQLIEPFIEIDRVVYEEGLKVYENFKTNLGGE